VRRRTSVSRRTRSVGASVVGVIVGVSLVAGWAAPADAAPANASERRVASKLSVRIKAKALGRNTSAIVLDASSGRVIWSRRATTGLMPASVAKLTTALTAMEVLGGNYTVKTRVRRVGDSRFVYLVGGGDAMLTKGQLRRLARTTAAALKSDGVKTAGVRVDDSLFTPPTRSRGWKKSYLPSDVAPVRPLVYNYRNKWDTSIDAGKAFAAALKSYGLKVSSVKRKHRPSSAVSIASHTSPPMRIWLARMLRVSDNDIAETVLRLTAVAKGKIGSWYNSRAVRNAVLKKFSITGLRVYDGSGLSRRDRMTAKGTAQLLRVLYRSPVRNDVIAWLPLAGKTGTLKAAYHRFTSKPASCAKGRIRAKTGTLGDAAALAGVATATNGRKRIFVILENGRPSGSAVRRAIDRVAATVTGCY
jgi:D-alanyl-D-alanine carboxypeptidase/D-alanyl-D-alanine-endopeptidase (penicillin-binding protein 4)